MYDYVFRSRKQKDLKLLRSIFSEFNDQNIMSIEFLEIFLNNELGLKPLKL